ncbi:response regulator [Roseateles sp.]|uniref:response regulator n=1 Tax=Roseateles sp. TaxID=1971397 RepID=UPI0031D5825E
MDQRSEVRMEGWRSTRRWTGWGLVVVTLTAIGWAGSAVQRWWLERDVHAALSANADREAISLMQMTMTSQVMGAVELSGMVDPLVKSLARITDVERAKRDRPGESHLATIARMVDGDETFVINGANLIIAEWVAKSAQQAIGLDVGYRPYVMQARKGRSTVFTSLSPRLGQRAILFTAPIHAGYETSSEVIGVVVARKLPDTVDRFLSDRRHAGALLVSPHGVVFAANRPEWTMTLVGATNAQRADELMAARRYAALFKDPAKSRMLPFDPTDRHVVEVDGQRMAAAAAAIDWNDPAGPWRLVLLDDLSAAMSVQAQRLWAALYAGLLLGGLLLMRLSAAQLRQRDRKAAEIAAQADQFRALMNLAPIGVGVVIDGRVEYANPALRTTLAVEQGQPWPERHADDATRELLETLMTERPTLRHRDVRLHDAAGEPRDFLLSAMPIDYDGFRPAVVLWLVDVTRRRLAAREARHAMEAAEDAALAKSRLLSSMSHEIRSPMNIILGMSDLALQTGIDSRQRNYLEKVHGAAASLLDLIDDILDFSRIESGRMTLDHVPFELDDVLDRLVDLIGLRAQDKGLELLIDLPPDVPTALVGDPVRLGQVLINLGNNAVKFTAEGEVIVTVEQVPPAVHHPDAEGTPKDVELRFSVRDSGIGMTEEACARLFQSFSQADPSTTRKYGGSGLGLAISKQLVEMMGGAIAVRSREGEGSSFSFTVKLGLQPVPRAVGTIDFSRLRALVADDNRAAREILGALCAGFGMRVDTAVNGAHAAQSVLEAQAANDPYDIVLMDWQMPVLNGLEAARLIADGRLPKPPAVLLVSAFSRDEALGAALAEFDAVDRPVPLSKPVTASALLTAISERTGQVLRPPRSGLRRRGTTRLAMIQLTGARLLVVEDDPVSREMAGELLRAAGLEVTLATNGQSALDLLAGTPQGFDAVLMDCQMPVMDGYETTRRIRSVPQWRDLPVIALTASAMRGDRDRILAAGMNDHLPKPLNVDRLFETLGRWLHPQPIDADPADPDASRGAAPGGHRDARAFQAAAIDPLEVLLERLTRRLQASDASAADLASSLMAELDRHPPLQSRLALLRRVAGAASRFQFEEALALLRWDGGGQRGGRPS